MKKESNLLKMTDDQLFDKVLTTEVLLQPSDCLKFEVGETKTLTNRYSEVSEGIIAFLQDNAEVRPILRYRQEPEIGMHLLVYANYHIVLSKNLFKLLLKGAGCFIGAILIYGGAFVVGTSAASISLAELINLLYKNFHKLSPYEQKIWFAISKCRKRRYRRNKGYFPSTKHILTEMGGVTTASEATKLRRNLTGMLKKGLVKQENRDRWWISW